MDSKSTTAQVLIVKDGPYIVSGDVALSLQIITPNQTGGSWEWKEGRKFEITPKYALCRCGQSQKKPFCDGSHAAAKFDGEETASLASYETQATSIEGPALVLYDAPQLCAFARFCDNGGTIWKDINKTNQPSTREAVVHEGTCCPSGRLVLEDKVSAVKIEPLLNASIGVVEDPQKDCSGPLWVRGNVPIISHTGAAFEVRNRVTLCRCGQSSNKPFCDGSHAGVKFQDGL